MQERLVEELLKALRSSAPEVREHAADELTDVHKSLSAMEIDRVLKGLVSAALQESVPACQEAQLNALSELKAWHQLDAQALQPLAVLRGRLQPAHLEYLDELLG